MSRNIMIALLAVVVLPPAKGQDVRFTAHKQVVTVDVLVKRNGLVLPNLQLGDFEIRDNGVLQELEILLTGDSPINVVFTLDLSRSVAGGTLGHLKAGTQTVLRSLRGGDKAALLTFSDTIRLRSPLSSAFASIGMELDGLKAVGETSLIDATYSALVVAATEPGRSLVLLFTDGLDSSSWLSSEMTIDAAKRATGVVYAVVPEGIAESPFTRDLTAATGGAVFPISSSGDLDQVFSTLLNEFRGRYVIGYSPKGVPSSGWHQLRVTLKGAAAKSTSVTARPGYQIGPTGDELTPSRPENSR